MTVKYANQHSISYKPIRRQISINQNWNESFDRVGLCKSGLTYVHNTGPKRQRKSLTMTSAVRRPETMAPWTEGVSR